MPYRKYLRLGAAGAALTALVLTVTAWRGRAKSASADSSLEGALQREQVLFAQLQDLRQSQALRRQIGTDLIEQRLSYAEAVAALRADDLRRPLPLRCRDYYFACSEEEKYSWVLLAHVARQLAHPQQVSTLTRLREQCRRHLARHGVAARDFSRKLRQVIAPLPPLR